SQLVLSIATDSCAYATNATEEEFWSHWEEKFESPVEESRYREYINQLKNESLSSDAKREIFVDRFQYVRKHFDELEKEMVLPTNQDEYLYNLCRPERLLDLAFNFIMFDDGVKKVARYQQYFAIKKTINRVRNIQPD